MHDMGAPRIVRVLLQAEGVRDVEVVKVGMGWGNPANLSVVVHSDRRLSLPMPVFLFDLEAERITVSKSSAAN